MGQEDSVLTSARRVPARSPEFSLPHAQFAHGLVIETLMEPTGVQSLDLRMRAKAVGFPLLDSPQSLQVIGSHSTLSRTWWVWPIAWPHTAPHVHKALRRWTWPGRSSKLNCEIKDLCLTATTSSSLAASFSFLSHAYAPLRHFSHC